jgi:hypothetical protein
MNDEFLAKYHKTPRAEFANALYERISQEPQPRFPQTRAIKLTFRNVAVAIICILLVAACVYYVVTEKRWNQVGGIWVEVRRTIKGDNPSLSGEPQVMEFQPKCLSIDKAKEILRFSFKVPAWAPAGFTFSDEICGFEDLHYLSRSAFLIWEGADKNTGMQLDLRHLFEQEHSSLLIPVAPGSYEEVQVHGQPAVLIRGDWNWEEAPWANGQVSSVEKYEYKWDKKRALQLYWVDGEVMYHLYASANVSPDDLIKMAESAR